MCDQTNAVDLTTTSRGDDSPVTRQVVVRRILSIPGGSGPQHQYDCFTEPAGCVIAVGTSAAPARGVAVPIVFRDESLPAPTIGVSPARDLQDGDPVAVHVTGLQPAKTYLLTLCLTGGPRCDEVTYPSAKASASGTIDTSITARAAIYSWQGRGDCATSGCSIEIRDELGIEIIEATVRFAPGVVAPVPRLRLEPAGPYRDGQTVTVVGTGFPTGFDIARWLGTCPADAAPETEAPCTYQDINRHVFIDRSGRFTTTFRAYRAGPCSSVAGCVFSWILNHGPAGASVPLEVVP